MHTDLMTLLPPALLDDPALVAAELPRALMTRANFIPGVRHRLGWRGVRDCAKGPGGLTVRVTGMTGVYGLEPVDSSMDGDTGRATFNISYFPAPDEDLVEYFSVQAGLMAQTPDYLARVREFTTHDDLLALFRIARLEACFIPEGQGVALSLIAPQRDRITARDGVVLDTAAGEVQAVAPGGVDQDLPALDATRPLFDALAASASYCLRAAPSALVRHDRPGTTRSYSQGEAILRESAPDLCDVRIGLAWNAPVPENALFTETDLAWSAPDPVPDDFADAPWWSPDIAGAANSLDKRTMGISDKPRLIVLTGFLGSGKTTFLARFIEEQAAKNSFVAVIQNEIGQKGLDGKLLGQSYAVTEVDEGCVCCTLAGSLRSALSGILAEFQPDFVILETTGLANPANLLTEIVDLDDMLDFASVTTVLDAGCAPKALADHEVARSQVRLADVLLLNKTDMVDEDALALLETRIRELNPTATLHRVVQGDIPSATLYGVNFRKELERPAPHLSGMTHATHQDDNIQSVLIDLDAPIDRTAFAKGVNALPEDVLRMKGVVQFAGADEPEVFQYVPGSHALTPAEESAEDCFLVLIGHDAERAAADFRAAVGV